MSDEAYQIAQETAWDAALRADEGFVPDLEEGLRAFRENFKGFTQREPTESELEVAKVTLKSQWEVTKMLLGRQSPSPT